MSNIVPFAEAGLPSAIVNRKRHIDVNKDIVIAAQFPSLSIKGKVFTLVQDSERRVLTKPDDPDEVIQAISMAFLRINMASKTYYAKRYTEGDSEGARPDCYTHDGKHPSPQSPEPQAKSCAACPHNVWGTALSEDGSAGEGKRCSDHARIAIADPRRLDKPMLIRVPPASLKPLKDALKMVKARQLQYNEVVFRVGFDREAASPKLTFKPVGVLPDADYEKACEQFESDLVRAICGLDEPPAAAAAAKPEVESDELDQALAARGAERSAKPAVDAGELGDALGDTPAPAPAPAAKPKPRAAAKPAPAPAPEPAPAPAPAVKAKPAVMASGDDDLLGDLDGILGATDD